MKAKYDLDRFISAQEYDYDRALEEIKNGKKQSHWIWYIFPQLKTLGHSFNAIYYGISDIEEAKLYLDHPLLSKRLIDITTALTKLPENDPEKVMGSIDSVKLRSCMTLFAAISEEDSVFQRVLDKYFEGIPDKNTLDVIYKPNNEYSIAIMGEVKTGTSLYSKDFIDNLIHSGNDDDN